MSSVFLSAVPPPTRRVRARYDNAQTTDENRRMWNQTDLLSAKAANSFMVRSTLRRRSRYEVANNSYAFGIVDTTVNDLISTGPTLQVLTPDDKANTQVENRWKEWSEAVNLTATLRTMAWAKKQDGEGILLLKTDPTLPTPVKLYPHLIETDQVMTPAPNYMQGQWVDGLELDQYGRAKSYHVLRNHPGDVFMGVINPLEFDVIPAKHVIFWFKRNRPGQVRGIPELTPALNLFAQIRRFSQATLQAAETAASISSVIESQGTASLEEADEVEPFDTIEMERNSQLVLPFGWKMHQFAAEHPTTTFDTYVDKLIAEACRCLNVPLNVALGTSQKFNFSSARLDIFNYRAGQRIERQDCNVVVLERLKAAWYAEARLIPNYLPANLPDVLPHWWSWPGWDYIDPKNDAEADTERLRNKTTTLQRLLAEQGKDWKVEFKQLGVELEEMKRLKLLDQIGNSGKVALVPGEQPGAASGGSNNDDGE